MKRYGWIVAMLVGSAGLASADDTVALPELVARYLEGNRELKRAESLIDQAHGDAVLAQRLDEWTLSGALHWSSRKRGFVAGNPFQTIGEDLVNANASLSRGLPTGGTVSLTMGAGLAKMEFAVLDQQGGRLDAGAKAVTSSLLATYKQPLLAGRGRSVARAESERAALATDRSKLAKRVAAEQALEALVRSFWELELAHTQQHIATDALRVAQEQARLSKLAVERRVAAPSELTTVTLAVARREQAVLVAEGAVVDQSIALRTLASLPMNAVALAPQPDNAPLGDDEPTPSLEGALQEALQQNAQVLAARQGVAIDEINRAIANDQVGSRLDIELTVGPDAQGATLRNALDQVASGDAYVASAGLTFSHGLMGYARRGTQAAAAARVTQAKLSVAAEEAALAAEVTRALSTLRIAEKRAEVAQLAIKLADEAAANERKAQASGESRMVDVLTRQDELAQAKYDAARATTDVKVAKLHLARLRGRLLPLLNVTWR